MKKFAALALLCALPVYASTARTEITGIQSTVVDLNSTDDIAANVTVGTPEDPLIRVPLDWLARINVSEWNDCEVGCTVGPEYRWINLDTPPDSWDSVRFSYQPLDPWSSLHFMLTPHSQFTLEVDISLSLTGKGRVFAALEDQLLDLDTPGTKNGTLTYTWVNNSSDPLWFNYRVNLGAETHTSPIPEPGTLALLLCGLAGVAGRARRKGTQRAV